MVMKCFWLLFMVSGLKIKEDNYVYFLGMIKSWIFIIRIGKVFLWNYWKVMIIF